ncbi:slipin family protein [Limibacter armeniacum]|uniref:slipin family protein n=1 Tax=Limibacter armeniacum TaxID=466084 RepID=UPI002FE50EF5
MKRVTINKGKAGLVFGKGDYKKVLTEGKYWISFYDEVTLYEMTEQFLPSINLNILLKDEGLAALLEVVEVADHEVVFYFENGNFKKVLTAGRYAFWKGVNEYRFVKADLSKLEITEPIDKNLLQRREVTPFIRTFHVQAYEKALLFVDGKFQQELETGVYHFWMNSMSVSILKADMRKLQQEVSGQEILTKDKAALRINFNTTYRVLDIQQALLNNKEYERQLYVNTQLALRAYIGTLTLDELLENKESVTEYALKVLKEKEEQLGVEVLDAGIKDIILPGEVKDIMKQVLVAQKQAEANTITRREETASTRSLLNTAKLMEDNKMLYKLKELEYIEKIADKVNSISVSGGGKIVDQLKELFG